MVYIPVHVLSDTNCYTVHKVYHSDTITVYIPVYELLIVHDRTLLRAIYRYIPGKYLLSRRPSKATERLALLVVSDSTRRLTLGEC